MGGARAGILYSVMTVLVYVWIIGLTIAIREPFLLIALLTFPFALKAIKGSLQHQDMNKLVPAMASNVQVVLLTQLLLGVGYILARVTG
jgi:1,4-dihydroxy-2-naphthoate octaprenyltransferase